MIVAAGFLQCAEVAESTWGPELSGPFVTTLAAEAGRLHRAAAYGPAPVRNLPVVHSVGLAGEIVFLSAQRLAALTSGTLERTDLGEHLRVLPMAQLVQPRLHPGLERRFVPPLTGPSQLPQVLGTVPEIQDLDGLLPAVRGQVPEPRDAIAHHLQCLGSPQAGAQRLPMQPSAQFQRLALPAHQHLLADDPAVPGRATRLLQPVEDAGPDFMPFHALFPGLFPPPTRSTKPRQPPVQHQHPQCRGRPLGLGLLGHLPQPLLRLGFRLGAQALHQPVHGRIAERTAPLGGHLRRGFIRLGRRRREGQLVLQRRTQLLVRRQTPALPNRTTPVPVPGILSVADLQFNDADAGAQAHPPGVAVHYGCLAEGGKPRRGEQLLFGASSPTAAASIRGLLPTFLLRGPAGSGDLLRYQILPSCLDLPGRALLEFDSAKAALWLT